MKRIMEMIIFSALFFPLTAWAHHGGVSLPFGPGSPIETNSPLTLPEGGLVLSTRMEQVEWRKFSLAEPANRDSFTFFNVGLSYGIKPYLTTSVFFPYKLRGRTPLAVTVELEISGSWVSSGLIMTAKRSG